MDVEKILASDDLPRKKLRIPVWNVTLYIQTLTALEYEAMQDDLKKWRKDHHYGEDSVRFLHPFFASRLAVNEDGSRVFKDSDIPRLAKKSCAALTKLVNAGMKLNGISEDEVEELAKNSEPVPDDSLPSDSP